MQRRAILLFVLLVVLAVLYATVTRDNIPAITAEQEAQTKALEQLDEEVLGKVESDKEQPGN